jgi:hypothetical protein
MKRIFASMFAFALASGLVSCVPIEEDEDEYSEEDAEEAENDIARSWAVELCETVEACEDGALRRMEEAGGFSCVQEWIEISKMTEDEYDAAVAKGRPRACTYNAVYQTSIAGCEFMLESVFKCVGL